MDYSAQTEIIATKPCHACGTRLLERHQFCRRCGASQSERLPSLTTRHLAPSPASALGPDDPTLPLTSSILAPANCCRPVSGPLVKAVMASLSANPSTHLRSRGARGIISILISIPIWLMIVLLSPFDAYSAAKGIANQF